MLKKKKFQILFLFLFFLAGGKGKERSSIPIAWDSGKVHTYVCMYSKAFSIQLSLVVRLWIFKFFPTPSQAPN